jgi:hypothetical protein
LKIRAVDTRARASRRTATARRSIASILLIRMSPLPRAACGNVETWGRTNGRFDAEARSADRVDDAAERGDGVGVISIRRGGQSPSGRSVQLPTGSAMKTSVECGGQPIGGVDERAEAAAEAPAGDLLDREAVRGQHGIDEADALSFVISLTRRPLRSALRHPVGDLAGAEAADHDVTGRCLLQVPGGHHDRRPRVAEIQRGLKGRVEAPARAAMDERATCGRPLRGRSLIWSMVANQDGGSRRRRAPRVGVPSTA